MFLLIDKPKGITSHGVVDKIRKVSGERRVGHAGTLDPNATGLLIIGVGRDSTKKLGSLSKNTYKRYTAEVILGEERDTDDVEGVITYKNTKVKPSEKEIRKCLEFFLNDYDQTPPLYSAIKIKGKRSYQLARQGKGVEIRSRKVDVRLLNLIKYEYPSLIFDAEVSSGTYIRSLARDIGKCLGTYAYLANLRRTEIGKFRVDNAVQLAELSEENWQSFAININ